MSQFFQGYFYQELPSACVSDTTPPTFAGITSSVAQSNGSILCSWSAATDTSPPINYEVYCALGSVSPATLFATTPVVIVRSLNAFVFVDSSGEFLVNDQMYTLGVRARDALGNLNTNNATLNAVSEGILEVNNVFLAKGVFSITSNNMLNGFLFMELDGAPQVNLLGTASYTFYDKDNVAVPGLSESGLTANVDGTYIISPVPANLLGAFTHYRVKVSITHNSILHTSYWGITIGDGVT